MQAGSPLSKYVNVQSVACGQVHLHSFKVCD